MAKKKAAKKTAKSATKKAKKVAKSAKKTAKKAVKKAKKIVKRAAKKVAKQAKKTASQTKQAAAKAKKSAKKTVGKAKKSAKKGVKKATKQAKKAKTAVAKTAGKSVRRPASPKTPRRPSRPRPNKPIESAVVRSAEPYPPVGALAPDFELMDAQGRAHRLSEYQGRRVVLYFYPKDDTPGCTKEACGFRDVFSELTDRDVVVLGVSPDSVDSHKRFVGKYGLNFPLLADRDHAVAEQYGAWGEKNRYGKITIGIRRTTFVIDKSGRIEHVFTNVRADGHEHQVLKYLDQ